MRFVITGTSGVGKTFLENVLQEKYGFIQIPKYTDRPKRPNEIEGKGIYFVDRNELQRPNHNYFFKLSYIGNIYGWKVEDLRNAKNKNLTIAITMESLQSLLTKDLEFIPILLYTKLDQMDQLTARIKKQLDYDNLSPENKLKADQTIQKRLALAETETKNIDKYIKIVQGAKGGKAFNIISDDTLFTEVIPYIQSLIK